MPRKKRLEDERVPPCKNENDDEVDVVNDQGDEGELGNILDEEVFGVHTAVDEGEGGREGTTAT